MSVGLAGWRIAVVIPDFRAMLAEIEVECEDTGTLPGNERVATFCTHGRDALRAWDHLCAALEPHGYWPIIVGEGRWDLLGACGWRSVAEILDQAESLDLDGWLQSRPGDLNLSDLLTEPKRSWPWWPRKRKIAITAHTEFDSPQTRRPRERCAGALVPTRASWELPAEFQLGDFHESPAAEVHVAMLRRWHQECGLRVVAAAADRLEVLVEKPPHCRDAAMRLAIEQYLYCPDNVDQGAGTVHDLAVSLWRAPSWYFWWD